MNVDKKSAVNFGKRLNSPGNHFLNTNDLISPAHVSQVQLTTTQKIPKFKKMKLNLTRNMD